MNNILLLASQSNSRKILLQEAKIPFELIVQSADEQACDWTLPFEDVLKTIAVKKMEHAVLPAREKKDYCFVLTADTMGQDNDGVIHGKPSSKSDVIEKIKALRQGGICGTAFCLDKKYYNGGSWHTEERILECVVTRYIFDMPDSWIEKYLESIPHYCDLSGGVTIQSYGAQFLKSIEGSYTTILGLPMFELRECYANSIFFEFA